MGLQVEGEVSKAWHTVNRTVGNALPAWAYVPTLLLELPLASLLHLILLILRGWAADPLAL